MRRARELDTRQTEAYACVCVRLRRRRLNASSKTGNERLRALVVSRRRPGLHSRSLHAFSNLPMSRVVFQCVGASLPLAKSPVFLFIFIFISLTI